jgi:acyl carrier protein
MPVTISSRTPEGRDSRCPLCGAETAIEYSLADDATCPNCGSLLWGEEATAARLRQIIAEQLGIDPDKVTDETSFVNDLGADSLDTVELVMVLEEEFDVDIPDDVAENLQTIGDVIRYLLRHRKWKPRDK